MSDSYLPVCQCCPVGNVRKEGPKIVAVVYMYVCRCTCSKELLYVDILQFKGCVRRNEVMLRTGYNIKIEDYALVLVLWACFSLHETCVTLSLLVTSLHTDNAVCGCLWIWGYLVGNEMHSSALRSGLNFICPWPFQLRTELTSYLYLSVHYLPFDFLW